MSPVEQSDMSVLARYGGRVGVDLPDGDTSTVGALLTQEFQGEGFVMIPGVLSRYERVLRIRPGESWLLQRMIHKAWRFGTPVYISLRKLERQACVTRGTVHQWREHLAELGYIRRLTTENPFDARIRYDVSPVYGALALCILVDADSNYVRGGGQRLSHVEASELERTFPMGSYTASYRIDWTELLDQNVRRLQWRTY